MENVDIESIADIMYEAPFALLAHNRFAQGVADEDSVFTYANKARLLPIWFECFRSALCPCRRVRHAITLISLASPSNACGVITECPSEA